MKVTKSLFLAGVYLSSILSLTSNVSATSGVIKANNISSADDMAKIGVEAPSVITLTLEGESHIYNFLVPAEGSITIDNLPSDDYAVYANLSDNFILDDIQANKTKGCAFDEYDYLTVSNNDATVEFTIKFKAAEHRGYTDSVHIVGLIS